MEDHVYNSNTFYPGKLTDLNTPYILRDFRGQAANVYPFQYNPVEKVLRVYTHLNVNIYNNGIDQRNILERNSNDTYDKEFKNIYEKQFLNFNQDMMIITMEGKVLVYL